MPTTSRPACSIRRASTISRSVRQRSASASRWTNRASARHDEEALAERAQLILHRGPPPRLHQHLENLAFGGFTPHVGELVYGVEDLVDHARDLALRDYEIATTEGAAPVRGIGPQDVEDLL